MNTRLSLLTGTRLPARLAKEPSPPQPDPMELVIESLEYLKLEPSARAKREAEPVITAERAAFEAKLNEAVAAAARQLDEERALRRAVVASLQAEMQDAMRLRQEAERDLRASLGASQEEIERLRAEAKKHAEETERRRAEAKKQPKASPAPQQLPQPAPALADIQFEYQRHDNGLLRHVVLKAKGFRETVIDIERGADNRMRNLKVRE